MNIIVTNIKARRSVRNFKNKEVSDEKLTQLLESIRWTPSWANTQCWELILVKKLSIKKQLQETVTKKNPAFKSVAEAPLLIVFISSLNKAGFYNDQVVTKFGDWFLYDLGAAGQNLQLTCCSLGLGTVPIGLFDHDKASKILNVPSGYEVVTMFPIGYPNKIPSPPKRKKIDDFVHLENW